MIPTDKEFQRDWDKECKRWYGRSLPITRFAHFCTDWDFLPINEHRPEFEGCTCFPHSEKRHFDQPADERPSHRAVGGLYFREEDK